MKIIKIFETLIKNNIRFVLIGGVALLRYGSDRVTFDVDIAVKTVDIDRIAKIMFGLKLKLFTGIDDNNNLILKNNYKQAIFFLKDLKWGFLKFLNQDLEIDFIYDLPLPFMQLYKNAIIEKNNNIEIRIASLQHLKIMKEKSIKNREDEQKRNIDKIDLEFIEKQIQERGKKK